LVRALLSPELLQKRLHGRHLGQWLVRLLPHAHLLQRLGLGLLLLVRLLVRQLLQRLGFLLIRLLIWLLLHPYLL
jgi:hypothetical protein